jgi:uncharacterized protein YdcH (DUF465 family)
MSKLLKSLILRSSFIQKKIDEEYSSKFKNWVKLIRLKKLRLKIKDKIYALTRVSMNNNQYRAIPLTTRYDGQ